MRIIYEQGPYRIVEIADENTDIENLMGDSYNPTVNPDIDPEKLAEEKGHFIDLVNNEGVFGYVLEKWNPEVNKGFEHVDSCWGFVGQYTPGEEVFNHYIVEELKAQIKEVK